MVRFSSRRTSAAAANGGSAGFVMAGFALAAACGGIVRAAEMEPGLVVTFEQLAGVAGKDSRVARMPALYVPEGEALTPFVDAGRFRAVWEGFLAIEFIDDFTFSAEGRGTVRLEIDGEVVLEGSDDTSLAKLGEKTLELEDGLRPIVVRYESPAGGDAVVRLFWSSFDFTREPVHPSALRHEPTHAGLVAGARLRRGRALAASRRCLGCHSAPVGLAQKGPSLDGIGDRLDATWMAHWIGNPRSLRADARMPALFPADSDGPRDVAAFLATLTGRARQEIAVSDAGRRRGAKRFDDVGCAACHVTTATDEEIPAPADARRSLAMVGRKWKTAALAAFLREPTKHYPSIGMPNFRLTPAEAQDLAAFLIALDGPKLGAVNLAGANIERGRTLVQASGCLGCHEAKLDNTQKAPGLAMVVASLDAGCLADDAAQRKGAPDFGLRAEDRDALRVFLETGTRSLGRRSAIEYAQRQIHTLRCRACHAIDGRTDLWSNLASIRDEAAGEPAMLLQRRPRLTWTGEKLRPEWAARVVTGTMQERLRPWLRARMPGFAVDGPLLARGLALAHGHAPAADAMPEVDAAKAAIGKALMMSKSEGFSCNTCHDVAGVKAEGAFDEKGPDFVYAARRLRHAYYHRWMANPMRLEPGTKMPAFSVGGKTPVVEVYGGDARQQFEAIWHHLIQLSKPTNSQDGGS